MRKTETGLGIAAGASGIILGLLSLMGVLPYRSGSLVTHDADTVVVIGLVLIAVNVAGIIGALTVRKHHVIGSVVMAAVTVAVLILGFPWQSLPAVIYIMSVVMALVPVKSMQ